MWTSDALRERLSSLDAILRAIGSVPDQQAATDAAAVAALRDAATQQIGGALSMEQFEARRTELLRVLDAVSRQNNPALQARIAPLRQRVLMLRAGETPEQRRARTQEMLNRVTLEIELAKSGETAAPSAIAAERDRLAAQSRLAILTRRLAELTRPVGVAARTPASPDEALDAITSLAAPCLKCHVMDGARLAPVAATQRVFRGARFHAQAARPADRLSDVPRRGADEQAGNRPRRAGRGVLSVVPLTLEGAEPVHDVSHLSSGRGGHGGALMSGRLLARSDSMTPKEFVLAETTRIGSGADVDVRLEASGVLALHATIQREGDRVWLVDQTGAAGRGTWLNGRRVSREWLQTLDVISIGSVDLVYLDA